MGDGQDHDPRCVDVNDAAVDFRLWKYYAGDLDFASSSCPHFQDTVYTVYEPALSAEDINPDDSQSSASDPHRLLSLGYANP